MTQYSGSMNDPFAASPAEPPRTSGLAISALVLSLLGIIPCCGLLLAPIGVLLGVIGAITLGNHPTRRGRGMAVLAIVVGLLFTLVWGAAAFWGVRQLKEYDQYMQQAPGDAMQTAFASDAAGFKAFFHGAGNVASDEEVRRFTEDLRKIHGSFISAQRDDQAMGKNPPAWGQPVIAVPFIFQFDQGTTNGRVEFVFGDQATGAVFLKKLGFIEVAEPSGGVIIFPPPSTGGSATSGP